MSSIPGTEQTAIKALLLSSQSAYRMPVQELDMLAAPPSGDARARQLPQLPAQRQLLRSQSYWAASMCYLAQSCLTCGRCTTEQTQGL